MKSVNLKYGNSYMSAFIDENNLLQVIKSCPITVSKQEDEIILAALSHPIGSARLKELVHEGETVCLVIPDSTRTWQKTDKYLLRIVEELNAGGVRDQDISFISALGSHRKQTPEEHRMLLGTALADRFTVVDHDCYDQANHSYLGETTYHTPVYINKQALACDHIILTGGIVYHFLAGWSGGKKYILPGIAAYETIMANHALSLNDKPGEGVQPGVRSGNGETNRLHQDMLEAASFVRPTFMFNVIMGPDGNIVNAVAGHYLAAHAAGQKLVDKIDGVVIKEQADLVIASAGGYPKDINLYQSIKTVINAREAAKPGGTIIILTECREGLGGNAEVQDMILNYDTVLEREKALRENYSISKYVGYYFCETAAKFQLILVSEIDPNLLNKANIKVAKTLEGALKLMDQRKIINCTIHLMPQAANTLPKLQ
jgi:nickel-dependent lactate racemase